jgi:hypothetical protein
MASIPGALSVKGRVDYDTYLQQVANSKFVAAPRGRGIDTHRAWEVSMPGCALPAAESDGTLDGRRQQAAGRLTLPGSLFDGLSSNGALGL